MDLDEHRQPLLPGEPESDAEGGGGRAGSAAGAPHPPPEWSLPLPPFRPQAPRPPRPGGGVPKPRSASAAGGGAHRLPPHRRTAWIRFDADGRRSFLHADRRSVAAAAGLAIPARDLRVLEPGAGGGALLVRDNAIVVSLEHVRLIVGADVALVPRESDHPEARAFVDDLGAAVEAWGRRRAAAAAAAAAAAVAAAGGADGAGGSAGGPPATAVAALARYDAGGEETEPEDDRSSSARGGGGDEAPLPFELVCLEAALVAATAHVEASVRELEALAMPALDALARSCTTANLERVRRVKTRHQRLAIRCAALRDELRRFLDDDDDMLKMAISRRREAAAGEAAAAAAAEASGDVGTGGGGWALQPAPSARGGRRASLSLAASFAAARRAADWPGGGGSPPRAARSGSGGGGDSPRGGGGDAPAPPPPEPAAAAFNAEEALAEVENLLESTYLSVDVLHDRLASIEEYAGDTEDLVNIELDAKRNRLIRLEIVLTAGTFALAPFSLLAGVLGENLVIPEPLTRGEGRFWGVNAGAAAACAAIFYAVVLYMKSRRLWEH